MCRITLLLSITVVMSGCLFLEGPTSQNPSDMGMNPPNDVVEPPTDVSPECQEPCAPGVSRCTPDGNLEVCEDDGTSCPKFELVQICEPGSQCVESEDFASCGCPDPCGPGMDPFCDPEFNEAVTCEFSDDFQCYTYIYEGCGDEVCGSGICGGEVKPTCEDPCFGEPTTCEGNAVRTCEFDAGLGCQNFKYEPCSNGFLCMGNTCKPAPECRLEDRPMCDVNNPRTVRTCMDSANGPKITLEDCPPDQVCRDGRCECGTLCEPGDARCTTGKGYEVCELRAECPSWISKQCSGISVVVEDVGCNGASRVRCLGSTGRNQCREEMCPNNLICENGRCDDP